MGPPDSSYVCDDCKKHSEFIKVLFSELKKVVSNSGVDVHLENTDIYKLVRETYFIVQDNPQLSVYSSILKTVLSELIIKNRNEITMDELRRQIKSTQNISRIIESMGDLEPDSGLNLLHVERKGLFEEVIRPTELLRNVASVFGTYPAQQQYEIRLASFLTMYVILYQLYQMATANTKEEMDKLFPNRKLKAPWVATMFLWTKRVEGDSPKGMFTDEEARRFFASRGLTSLTINNYLAALKTVSPEATQRLVANITAAGEGYINFTLDPIVMEYLDRLYNERVRGNVRT